MRIYSIGRYQINCESKITYNLPTYDEPNNWYTEVKRKQQTVNGDKLLALIKSWLDLPNKSNLYELHIDDNSVLVEEFNPYIGETSEWLYKITEVKPNKSKEKKI